MKTEKIDSVAAFKRAMVLDSKWEFFDSILGDTSKCIRTCKVSQSNSFALDNHPNQKDKTILSWLDYPKAKDVLFIQEENKSTKVRINLDENRYLIYSKISN